MAIKITRWSPDTCGCILEYEWDDSVEESQRTHTATRVVVTCKEHSKLDESERFDRVKEENILKNQVETELLSKPELTIIDTDGTKKFKQNVKFDWKFNNERELVIKVDGVDFKETDKQSLLTKYPVVFEDQPIRSK